ncbi:MAG: hypothetical protein V1702_01570 [Candidatus Woesearchaeota archaeon]
MNKTIALIIILVISIGGMAFSGYLSYGELIQKTCSLGGCSSMFGVPVCVYGFVMYLTIFLVSFLGLRDKQKV